MPDFGRYLRSFENAKFSEVVCKHCWTHAKSASAVDAVCNFCEQHVSASAYALHNPEAEAIFLKLQSAAARGLRADDLGALDALSRDAQIRRSSLHLCKILLDSLDSLYLCRNYALPGFMEENSGNIKASLGYSARSKELFYGAIALSGTEPASGAEAESLLFMEFLCWIKLGRLADASRVLRRSTSWRRTRRR